MANSPKGRRVKCFETGAWGTSLTFYKAPDGHWYQNESIYQSRCARLQTHRQLIDALYQAMAFDPSMAFPTVIPKTLKELSFYPDAVILQTLLQCKDAIDYAMRTKEFSSEYNRAAYVMAILKNNINDVYKAAQQAQRQSAQQSRQTIPCTSVFNTLQAQAGSAPAAAHDLSAFLPPE